MGPGGWGAASEGRGSPGGRGLQPELLVCLLEALRSRRGVVRLPAAFHALHGTAFRPANTEVLRRWRCLRWRESARWHRTEPRKRSDPPAAKPMQIGADQHAGRVLVRGVELFRNAVRSGLACGQQARGRTPGVSPIWGMGSVGATEAGRCLRGGTAPPDRWRAAQCGRPRARVRLATATRCPSRRSTIRPRTYAVGDELLDADELEGALGERLASRTDSSKPHKLTGFHRCGAERRWNLVSIGPARTARPARQIVLTRSDCGPWRR